MHSPNQVGGSASSHGSESTSPCPATSQAKSVVNIEESSGNNEEAGRKGTWVNWTEEENLRLLSSWLNNSVDPIDSNDKKSEYYWRAVAAEYNNNTRRNDRKRTVVKCKTHWGGVDDGKRVRRDGDENRVAGGKRVRRTRERNWGSRTCRKESRGSHGILLSVIFFFGWPHLIPLRRAETMWRVRWLNTA
jgi:hypothetical protein